MIQCLHCRMPFKEHEGPPILGQSEDQKFSILLQRLGAHFKAAHGNAISKTVVEGKPLTFSEELIYTVGQVGVLLVLSHFNSDDPKLHQKRTEAAALLNGFSRRVLTDDDIERILDRELRLPKGQASGAAALLRQMRDWMNYSDIPELGTGKAD